MRGSGWGVDGGLALGTRGASPAAKKFNSLPGGIDSQVVEARDLVGVGRGEDSGAAWSWCVRVFHRQHPVFGFFFAIRPGFALDLESAVGLFGDLELEARPCAARPLVGLAGL